MNPGLPQRRELARTIQVLSDSDIHLSQEDPDWIILINGNASGTPVNPTVKLPTVCWVGKTFTFRWLEDTNSGGAHTLAVTFPVRLAGGTATFSVGIGQVATFLYTDLGWIPPPGKTTSQFGSRGIAIGSNSRATGSSSTDPGGVAIGENATSDGRAVAIGVGAGGSAKGVAVGNGAAITGNDVSTNGAVAIGLSATVNTAKGVAVGGSAQGGSAGVAVGDGANGIAGVAVGTSATTGSNSGVALGTSANSAGATSAALGASSNASGDGSTALGSSANTNNKGSSIAFGFRSKPERFREVAHGADEAVTTLRAWSFLNWYADTANATPAEIFLGGTSANRATLLNASAFNFRIDVIARDNTGNVTSGWRLEGVIRRGANAAATAIVGTVTKTVVGQDAGAAAWDVAATADTTNGALILTVTGAAATTIRWVATAFINELRF